MGQVVGNLQNSAELHESVNVLQDEILHHGKQLYAAAICSYDEFQSRIHELNALSSRVTSQAGRKLIFGIKGGTDGTLLWRATVRISVVQWDVASGSVVSSRLLNLPQFLRAFTTIHDQLVSALPSTSTSRTSSMDASCSESGLGSMRKELTFSMLLNEVEEIAAGRDDKLAECCICLERQPEVMLPCAHAYCLVCIETWNTTNKTCPICREAVQTTDDAWVIPDIPGSEDVNREICSSLMGLSTEPEK